MSSPARILVVAHRTAATPKPLEQVRTRAEHGSFRSCCWCGVRLGTPRPRRRRRAFESSRFDQVIVSTLPHRVSHWLRLDLPARIERLGVAVTVVTAAQSDRAWEAS